MNEQERQRHLLFRTWEETENVTEACARAQVSRQTFYNWKARFDEGGYEALNECRSRALKPPNRIGRDVEDQVVEMRREHPDWGKKRIADELAKRNNGLAVVSHNTVKRILVDAGLWPRGEGEQ